jgi:predicted NUDIX family phosphoesterase
MEFVYVVKRYDLFDLEFPHGFQRAEEEASFDRYMERIRDKGFFIERRFTENDSSFKQIIPYSLIAHDRRILVLTRTDKQGEARLHNKKSIGVGGHINPEDGMEEPLRVGCRREIDEELDIGEEYEARPVGIINDESNSVGSVHFGVVHVVKLKNGSVKVRETTMMTAEFVEYQTLQEMAGQGEYNFETWSSLIINSPELHMLLD